MTQTAAEMLVERLHAWGVEVVFGFAGDGIGEILEALRRQQRIRFVQVRHEEAAAFAACGYAKFTGRLGVCLATSGPGGVHLANGLYDAQGDDQPVLAITGQTWSHLIGTHYQQDVALDRLYADVAAYSERVMNADHLPRVLDAAIKTALARRTVAHVNIPRDVQRQRPAHEYPSAALPRLWRELTAARHPLPPASVLQEAADLINAGRRVAILAGRGAIGAREQVIELAERVAGPIIKPLLGKTAVPDDSPYTTGGIGLLGTAPSVDALRECDTLVIIGSSFPYLDFYPKPGQARVVQIDRDPTRIGLRHEVDVGLVGDSHDVLQALLPLVRHKSDRSFLAKAQERMHHWNRLMEQEGTNHARPLKPQVVFYELNKLLADDAIITCDSGTDTTWIARHLRMRGRMQFSLSGTLSTMACSLPYAIGAAIAYPSRQIICVAGDGALTMLMGELATVAYYQLPIKIVVVKNNTLNQVRWEQLVQFGYPEFAVELQPIDFAAVARACGVAGYSVDDPAQVAATLQQALAQPGPALVECAVDPNAPPMPGKVTTQQALALAEALLKGQPDRLQLMREAIAATARELRTVPEAFF
ncbi:MAG TPA: thiamine pyrophosphate-dependent enzyme [Chloroflexota bacterium]|nr:thiamine pyrophosphate-dependent enzyme [Chloroflexota bacterium]